jgi:hypothetical protein
MTNKIRLKFVEKKGGAGSGHHGHAGRPGKVGGSSSGKGEGGVFGGYDSFEGLQAANTRSYLNNLSGDLRSYLQEQGVNLNTDKALLPFVESLTQTQAKRILNELDGDKYMKFYSMYTKVFDELYGKRSTIHHNIFSGYSRK